METTEITIGSAAKAHLVTQQALSIRIIDDATWKAAQAYLVDVDKAIKDVNDDLEKLKRPYLDELAKIRHGAALLSKELSERRTVLVTNITAYEDARDAAARIEQAKDLKKWERHVEHVEAKAEARGAPVPVVPPPPVREMVSKTQHIGSAKITTVNRTDWKIRDVVVDGQVEPLDPETLTYADVQRLGLKIPARFFTLNTTAIGKIIRSGGEIPDIEAIQVKTKSISHH